MSNVHILFDNPADDGEYSGGGWLINSLNRLKTPLPGEAARSVGASVGSTTFTCDLLTLHALRMFALIGTNLTTAATVRIIVSNAADLTAPVLDVTVPAYQPNVPWGSMPWGAFPWNGFRSDYKPGGAITLYRHATSVFGRYVRIEISDAANPDKFVQIGRFMCGEPFVPRINMAYGVGLRFLDESVKTKSRGGSVYWDKKPKTRLMTLQLPYLTEGEAWGAAYDLQARLGLTGNLLLVYDPAESTAVRLRRTIYGSLTQLDDIVTASPSVDYPYSWNLAVEELI
ncbi:hypothetical protein [Methylorubrum salsuginis]|uniref:Phage tail protein n=1 Tax=Methylorubrum salsuginis TaxID=414703 RepID=A0A1I4FMU2_9HYPH|nr:hypothetical protein [Methylorubrum salsuginis]SFL18823.1 hypothetical protein SAMN04488125_110109 [Methylorubrum salsuginis]